MNAITGHQNLAAIGSVGQQPSRTRVRVALQGGGALGAYGAGVLIGLSEDPAIEIEEATGLSAGANNLYVHRHAGAEGLKHLWGEIGRIGESARPVNFITSYLAAAKHPLQHIEDIMREAIEKHGLSSPHGYKMHVTAAAKIGSGGDLDIGNVRKVTFSGREATLEACLASSTLRVLKQDGFIMPDGNAYYDGVYTGLNPDLGVFCSQSTTPIIVVCVDEPEIRRSWSDPYIQYGLVHGQVDDLAPSMAAPIIKAQLRYNPRWVTAIRTRPSVDLSDELLTQGINAGRDIREKITGNMAKGMHLVGDRDKRLG